MVKIGYILKQDILTYIDKDALTEQTGGSRAIGANPAVEGNDSVWERLVPSTIGTVEARMRTTDYDSDNEFRPFYEYSASEAFTAGQRVSSAEDVDEERSLYLCIQDAPAGTPLTDTAFFEPKDGEDDDRSVVVVKICCKLIIYELASRLNPRQAPEQRKADHENMMAELKDGLQMGENKYDVEKEVLEPDDARQRVSWGGFEDITQDSY